MKKRVEWLNAVLFSLIVVCAFQTLELQYLKNSYIKNIKKITDNQNVFHEEEVKAIESISKILTYHTKLILKHENILVSEGD